AGSRAARLQTLAPARAARRGEADATSTAAIPAWQAARHGDAAIASAVAVSHHLSTPARNALLANDLGDKLNQRIVPRARGGLRGRRVEHLGAGRAQLRTLALHAGDNAVDVGDFGT